MPYDPLWECFPVTARQAGEQSDRAYGTDADYKVTLTAPGINLDTTVRKRSYLNNYRRTINIGDPWLYDLDSYYVNSGAADTFEEFSGTITESYTAMDRTIEFMDLRCGLVVYKEDSISMSAGGTSTEPLGNVVADIGSGFKTINALDVFPINFNHTNQYLKGEKIKVAAPKHTHNFADVVSASNAKWRLGCTDYSGWDGGLSHTGIAWGTYLPVDNAVDQNPIVDVDYLQEQPYQYELYPPWLEFATNRAVDQMFAAMLNDYMFGNASVVRSFTVPVLASITSGSWATSGKGDLFFSMQGRTGSYYNVLKDANSADDPELKVKEFIEDTQHTYSTYYPIAPV